jgi:bifunctional DNA-binding transcriptional regulator/antitoxin component of YhaV-PrlF toxin-antitoxin module
MKQLPSRISTKGQATIPVEVRRLLGVGPPDEIGFVIDAGEVRLTRAGSVVARTAGALKSDEPPLAPEELREAAERAMAEEVVERMRE